MIGSVAGAAAATLLLTASSKRLEARWEWKVVVGWYTTQATVRS